MQLGCSNSSIHAYVLTESVEKTVNIEKKQLEIEERGVKLRLTIVDTPGFNDAVNGEQR